MSKLALVLGAGGNAAIAWEVGVITGFADAGIDLRAANVVVGTSAGSVVGAQLTSGLSPEDLFQRQVDGALQSEESVPPVDLRAWRTELIRIQQQGESDAAATLRHIGRFARAAPTVDLAERTRVIAARLPTDTWPDTRLLIVAVNVATGERTVFDRASGVSLADAVTASCAVPGIWPTVLIDGQPYMDGGMYSLENADLAADSARVLIVSLPPAVPPISVMPVERRRQPLYAAGRQIRLIQPDAASQATFASVGGNLLDPSVRQAAARAGREQGRRLALTEVAW